MKENLKQIHKHKKIGLLIPGMRTEMNISLAQGVKTAASETGSLIIQYCIGILKEKKFNADVYNILAEIVDPDFLDGLIITPNIFNPDMTYEENLEVIRRYAGIPAVLIGKGLGDYPCVRHDDHKSILLAVKHFAEVHKFSRISLICGQYDVNRNEYQTCYKKALQKYGLTDFFEYHALKLICQNLNNDLLLLVKKLIKKGIQGIIFDENIKRGNISFLVKKGIKIPEDIAFIALDNVSSSYMTYLPHSTIDRSYTRLGYTAVRRLLALLEGERIPASTLVPVELIIRRSCGCYSQPVRDIAAIRNTPAAKDKKCNFLDNIDEKISELTTLMNSSSDNDKKIKKLLLAYEVVINKPDNNRFLKILDGILRQESIADRDLNIWHKILTCLVNWTVPYLNDESVLVRMQDIWQQARMLLAENYDFDLSLSVFESGGIYDINRVFAEKLASTFDLEKQLNLLVNELPRIGIECAFLVLYENPGPYQYPGLPPEWSELVLAFDQNGRIEPDTVRFKTCTFLPQKILDFLNNQAGANMYYIVEGLIFELKQIGYAVFGVSGQMSDLAYFLRGSVCKALQGARIYRQIQEQTRKIEDLSRKLRQENLKLSAELNVVGQLQKMILPAENVFRVNDNYDLAVYMQPSDEVAGDYYDIIRKNRNIYIGMGDVTGHGLESGVIMIMLQTAIRTLIENGEKDLRRIYQIVNRVLYKNIKRIKTDKKLTVLITELNDKIVNLIGFHDEPFIVRNNGGLEVIKTTEMGTLVGAKQELADSVKPACYELKSGDNIVLFTDGITEARNRSNEFYTEKRLHQIVSENCGKKAEDIKNIVIRDLDDFIGENRLYDDASLIIIKVL